MKTIELMNEHFRSWSEVVLRDFNPDLIDHRLMRAAFIAGWLCRGGTFERGNDEPEKPI